MLSRVSGGDKPRGGIRAGVLGGGTAEPKDRGKKVSANVRGGEDKFSPLGGVRAFS